MDLSFSAEEQAFRREVREFIEARLDPALHRRMCEGRGPSKEQLVVWQTTLAERGWATPAWPVEHGGPGWDAVWRLIFLDEIHQAPAPEPLSFNSAMLGPTLIAFGSEEQKERFLPDMATLKSWWCQGFSEAGAGSDLAAVTTTAVLDGDHYVVSGHKLWQGMAHRADWMFALVRTDLDAPRKQQGLSFLLIDMTSPGLAVRPILTIDQRHEVNEIFLDAVRVPVGNRVGAEGDGWTITKYLLAAERTNIARTGMTRHILRRVKAVTGDDRSIRRSPGPDTSRVGRRASFRCRARSRLPVDV